MGFYTRYTDPNARKVITQYYQFIRRHDRIYRRNQPAAASMLSFPAQPYTPATLRPFNNSSSLATACSILVLFDILPDDLLKNALARYGAVFVWANRPQPAGPFSITAPKTVRASLSQPAAGDALHLHFVNYNRTEPKNPRSAGGGIHDEKPIIAEGMRFTFTLPQGKTLDRVTFLTPEQSQPQLLITETHEQRIIVSIPNFLVYGVVELTFRPSKNP